MLSERLKQLRIEKDLLQKDIAEKLKISTSAYGFYEQGKRTPDADTLKLLAEIFEVSVDYLLGRTNDSNFNREEKIKEIEQMQDFENAEDALKFILAQPSLMHYGGYDLKNMSHEEILEIANDMLFAMRLSIEKMRKKNR